MYAQIAADYIHAYCTRTWPEDALSLKMASTVANGSMIDVFDHKGGGSSKYIPAKQLTADLGEPEGAGVYGYWLMGDGSYLLRTCNGRLAYWSGNEGHAANWAI